MKKYLATLIIIIFIAPIIANASWWNPLTWFNRWNFHKKETVQGVSVNQTNSKEESLEQIKKLQTEVDNLKNLQKNTNSEPSIKTIDNHKIELEIQAKLKAEQDELIIQQKIEQETLLAKQKAEQDAISAKQQAEEQAKIDAANKLATEAEAKKSQALKEINLEIANLNDKYNKDVEAVKNNPNLHGGIGGLMLDKIYEDYLLEYNKLQVEYQKIQYMD